MTNRIQSKILAIEDQSRVIFYTLAVCVLVGIGLYLSLLAGTFMGGVERQELTRQTEILHTSIQELEAKYLAINNKIDIDYAKAQGFVAVNNTEYLTVKSDANSNLTLNR